MGYQLTADDRHCLKCFYHFRWGAGAVGCEFILVTGKLRGCGFGLGCSRFINANPRLRWGIEKELEPGEVPGVSIRENGNPRQMPSRRKAIDVDAVNKLKHGRSWAEIAKATGYSETAWKHIKSNGGCSIGMAQAVETIYGINILAK